MGPADESGDEIVPDPSEALEFESIKRVKPRQRGLWMGLLFVAVAGSASGGWYFYGERMLRGDDAEVPVIHAAEGPVKVRPENPGGMAIPDRDKLVYDRMKGGVEEPRVERLLPPPELPKTPPVPVATPEPEVAVVEAPKAIEKPKELPKPQKLEPGKVKQKKPVVKEVENTEPAVVVNTDVIPKAETPKPVAKPSAANVSSAFGLAYQIQIAAVRSDEKAQAEWKRLKKKHGDLLGGFSLNVVRVDLGVDKGIFYRLRAGPIAGEDVAKALCQNLAKRKVGCLIVRPGG